MKYGLFVAITVGYVVLMGGMSLSSVSVIANAIRLRGVKLD